MFGEIQVDGSRLLKPGKNLITVKVTRKMDEAHRNRQMPSISSILPYVKVNEDAKVEEQRCSAEKFLMVFMTRTCRNSATVKTDDYRSVKVKMFLSNRPPNGATFDVTLELR